LPELTPAQLRRHCEPSHFEFTDTTQIGPTGKLAGQDRARASLDFGLGIAGQGFNIYAMGPAGTGRRTGGLRALRQRARGGQPLTAEAFAALPAAEQQRLEAEGQHLQGELEQALRASRAEEKALRAQLAELDKQISAVAVGGPFDELEHTYAAFPEVVTYLQAARRDVLENIALFHPPVEAPTEAQDPQRADTAPAGPAARAAAEVGRPVQQLHPRVRYGVN